jgi:hypothetical protein
MGNKPIYNKKGELIGLRSPALPEPVSPDIWPQDAESGAPYAPKQYSDYKSHPGRGGVTPLRPVPSKAVQ